MSNYQGVQFYPRCCRGTISNSCRSCYCCWSMLFFLRIIADSIYPHDSPWSNIKKTKGNLFKTAGSQAYLEADINEMMPHATEIRLLDISERMENQQPTSGGIARKGPPASDSSTISETKLSASSSHRMQKAPPGVLTHPEKSHSLSSSLASAGFEGPASTAIIETRRHVGNKGQKILKGYKQVNSPVAVGPANWPS